MLKSGDITLRAIEERDLQLIANWRNDVEVYDYFYEYLPVSLKKQTNWYTSQLDNPREINFVIDSQDKAIGTVGIYNIDTRNRKAEWGRLIIGDKTFRGHGVGALTEALIIEYAFEHLNLHKLYCEVLESNETVIKLHKKFGFKEEAMIRDHVFKYGKYSNIILLSLIDQEYFHETINERIKKMVKRSSV